MPNFSAPRRFTLFTLLLILVLAFFSYPGETTLPETLPNSSTGNFSLLSSASAHPLLACTEVCTKRVPPGCERSGNPWDVCACVEHETVCTGPPDPTISGTLTCSVWGNNGWCIENENLDLVATEPDGENVLISGDLNGEPSACGPEAGSVSCSIPLPEGTGIVNYLATSAQGTTASGSKSWMRDAIPPVIAGSVSATSGNNGWFISIAELSASATESGSGLSAFETSLDGTSWTPYAAPLTFTDGMTNLRIRATDIAGNQANVDLPINVDTVSPAVDGTLSGTMGSANWYISAVQASFTASDATSGIASFESSSNSGVWAAYAAPLIFGDGQHTVIFRAVDVAGNSSETSLYTFKADASAPHINLPDRWYIWESITFHAKEETSGFTSIEMQIMDSQRRWKKVEEYWTTDQTTFSHTLLWNRQFADGILAPIGNYPVVIRAWDAAGNMTEKTGQIMIPQPNAAPLPTSTPTPLPEVIVAGVEPATVETQEVAALVAPV